MAKPPNLGFPFVLFWIFFSLSNHVCCLVSPLERWPSLQKREISVISSFPNLETGYEALFTDIIDNKQDVRYAVVISLNDRRIPVFIDTGSTDLWVESSGFNNFIDTHIPLQLQYGDGTYGVNGTIGLARFQLGSIDIPQQAFLNATKNTFEGVLSYGVNGILGLSFDTVSASPIEAAIQTQYGNSSTLGYSVLNHYFNQQQHPRPLPKVIALRLTRADDPDETTGGSLAIGEYESKYSGVVGMPKLAQYPQDGDRWTTLLEKIYVDGKSILMKSRVEGVPVGRVKVLFDTGAPKSVFPVAIWDAIYSSVPGAVRYSNSRGQDGKDPVWIVPCKTTSVVEFAFGGRKYPIHPLELTVIRTMPGVTACISEFDGLDNYGGSSFEILLGVDFLRNVYSAFNFGDSGSQEKPYMQLLSTIDIKKAVAQVSIIRKKQMAGCPPELSPTELIRRLGGGTISRSLS